MYERNKLLESKLEVNNNNLKLKNDENVYLK